MVKIEINGKEQYYNESMVEVLNEVRKMLKRDKDVIAIYDGNVGEGKSTKCQQDLLYVDPTLGTPEGLNRVCFDAEDFKKAVLGAKKKQAIIFDEALGGLNIRRTMSSINVTLIQLLTEIRQKNLFIGICLPSIFDLDKSIAIHRSTYLVNVFSKNGERGFFNFYGREAKKRLFTNTMAKRTYQYFSRPSFVGRFTSGYVIDEELYRKKKDDVLKRYLQTGDSKKMVFTDAVKLREAEIYSKLFEFGISQRKMEEAGLASKHTIYQRMKLLNSKEDVNTSE